MQPWHRDSSRSSFQFHEPWLSYFLVSKLMNIFVALQSTLYYPGYTKLCFGNKQLPNLSSFTQQRCTCHSTKYALQVGCGLRLSQTLKDIGYWRLYPNNHHSSGKGTWQSTLAVKLLPGSESVTSIHMSPAKASHVAMLNLKEGVQSHHLPEGSLYENILKQMTSFPLWFGELKWAFVSSENNNNNIAIHISHTYV